MTEKLEHISSIIGAYDFRPTWLADGPLPDLTPDPIIRPEDKKNV